MRPCQEDKFVEVIGPFIPCIQGKDDRYQVIYGVIKKNGDYSKGHPYDNYYHAFNPIINFEKSDIEHLNIDIYDKVTGWFYYGFSDDYYDYYEDGTDFVTIKPGKKGTLMNKYQSHPLENNFEFRMPGRLGYIRIRKKLAIPKVINGKLFSNHLGVDYKATKELWKEKYPGKTLKELKNIENKPLIKYLNDHTDQTEGEFPHT